MGGESDKAGSQRGRKGMHGESVFDFIRLFESYSERRDLPNTNFRGSGRSRHVALLFRRKRRRSASIPTRACLVFLVRTSCRRQLLR